MNNKQGTAQGEDSLSHYLKYKNYAKELEKNNLNEQSKDKIFADFLGPAIEDSLVLLHKFSLKELMDKYERSVIISALNKCEGSQKKTAEFLKLKPSTLSEKVKKYNISFRKIPIKN